ncbi:MAG TPA: AMP-binding protein [Clostridiaceae bacterium]
MVGNIYKKVYNANSIAIKFKGNSITYEQLDKTVNQYANFLKKLGVKVGERVILSCPNSPEFIYSYLSVTKNGGIIVPINLQLTMEEIVYSIKDCEANFMIIHPSIF